MADTKLSALTALTGASVATGDLLYIDDISATTSKSITVDQLRQASPFTGAFAARATFNVWLEVACSDDTTAIGAATDKATFRNPFGGTLTVTGVRCHVKSACTTGTFTVDINDSGTTILSTKLTLDATEKTSQTAATPPVISDSSIADDAIITVDVDNAGDGTATGLKIVILGTVVV